MPNELDPERFSLPQAAQARDAFAQIMDELEFLKAQLARLPTRRDQAFVPLRTMFGSAVMGAALVIGWIEAFLAALPLSGFSRKPDDVRDGSSREIGETSIKPTN